MAGCGLRNLIVMNIPNHLTQHYTKFAIMESNYSIESKAFFVLAQLERSHAICLNIDELPPSILHNDICSGFLLYSKAGNMGVPQGHAFVKKAQRPSHFLRRRLSDFTPYPYALRNRFRSAQLTLYQCTAPCSGVLLIAKCFQMRSALHLCSETVSSTL